MGQAVGPGGIPITGAVPHHDRAAGAEGEQQVLDHVRLVAHASGVEAAALADELAQGDLLHGGVEVGLGAVAGDAHGDAELVEGAQGLGDPGQERGGAGLEGEVLLLDAALHDQRALGGLQVGEEGVEALGQRQTDEGHPLLPRGDLALEPQLLEGPPCADPCSGDPEAVGGQQGAVQVEEYGVEGEGGRHGGSATLEHAPTLSVLPQAGQFTQDRVRRMTPSLARPSTVTDRGFSRRSLRTKLASSTAGCRANHSQSSRPSPKDGLTVK